jgi:hypothetical protein
MKATLKITEGKIYPADPISHAFISGLADGNYHVGFPSQISNKLTDDVRRIAQNSLYWGWLGDLSKTRVEEYSGWTQNEWHEYFKKKHLIQIFLESPEQYPQYAASYAALEEMAQQLGKGKIYQEIEKSIVGITSTTKAKVKDFAEYLRRIEHDVHDRGIPLRTDSGLFRAAITGDICA